MKSFSSPWPMAAVRLPLVLAGLSLVLTTVRANSPSMPQIDCQEAGPPDLEASWIPSRPEETIGGLAFSELTLESGAQDRQRTATDQILQGNIPSYLRRMKPVHLSHRRPDGSEIHAVIWVTPDYVSIGSDDDFLRIPLNRPSAVAVARAFGCVLPTRKIVDAIEEQANFHFRPQPMKPGKEMRSTQYYLRHNRMIEEQRAGRPLGELVAGHKKDLVVTNRLLGRDRIAIYGWHKMDGDPIQGLSTVHGARYADYSHGLRLVYQMACVDGRLMSIYDVLQDQDLAYVLSYEGQISRIAGLMRW